MMPPSLRHQAPNSGAGHTADPRVDVPPVGAVPLLLWGLLFLLIGCESNDGVVDTAGTPPHILSVTATPDIFVLDTIGTGSGTVTLQSVLRATVRNQSGGTPGAPRVTASISAGGSTPAIASISLREESNASGIRVFSGTLPFTIPRSSIGSLSLSVRTESPDGLQGNMMIRQVVLRRSNARPLLTRLSAPDTVTLPPLDSLLIPMTVTASDSNGADDIREVYFRSLDSSDPTRKFFLFDNGSSANGDAAAGDGVYSIIVQLKDSPTVRKTYRFAFQASDGAGDTSLTVLHRLTVR